MYKVVFFVLLFTSFISINIHAEENETLNQIIQQFKVDATEINALLAIEQKLKQQKRTFQLQITTAESTLAQLVIKLNRLEKKLNNNPSELDKEFLKLDEEVISNDVTNAQSELNAFENNHSKIYDELTQLATNLTQLKEQQIDKRKNIKLLITDKNTKFESINRSITYPCETVTLIEKCKTEAKNILLREISEQFAGLELQSITEVDNYLLVKDEVKTESKVIFNSVDIIGQDMIIVSGQNHLKLTLSAELKKELTKQDLTLLHLKIDTALDKFLQGDVR
jgi:chromosome segregation ATPase